VEIYTYQGDIPNNTSVTNNRGSRRGLSREELRPCFALIAALVPNQRSISISN
jgi:hypothetical protein